MTRMSSEEFLEHYGVKGMKWGVRRSAAELGRAAKQQKQARKDAKAATERTRYVKGVKDAPRNLTDDELKKRISRMETEKKYNELNAKTVTKGQQLTSEIITNAGKKVAVATLASGGALIAKNAIRKKFKLEPDEFNIKVK